MAIIQLRVDDELKQEATNIYEKLGIDLSTAIRMFLKRSVMDNGIPFSMVLGEPYDASKALEALRMMQDVSEKNGNSNMTLDEINEEIMNDRKDKKKNR